MVSKPLKLIFAKGNSFDLILHQVIRATERADRLYNTWQSEIDSVEVEMRFV